MRVLMTLPQSKAIVFLGLAALLTAVAALLIGMSRPAPGAHGVTSPVAESVGTASPGSTATARSHYRASLDR